MCTDWVIVATTADCGFEQVSCRMAAGLQFILQNVPKSRDLRNEAGLLDQLRPIHEAGAFG